MGEWMDPRKTFGKAVTELAEKREEIVVLSADSGKSSGFSDFIVAHPERYFECGIMEQGVIGFASGLATTGKIPVFCAIAPFVTARPYEMFRNDLGYMQQNVKIVGRNCGITYSDLGSTHHSLDDFALMRMIPGVAILAPQDPYEIIDAVSAMMDWEGPCYMRIGNAKIEAFDERLPFAIGKGHRLADGDTITLVTTGSVTAFAMRAVRELRDEGIYADHIGMGSVWPIDAEQLLTSVRRTGKVVTVEEHYVKGGLGSIVLETLSENDLSVPLKRHGVPHIYASNGSYEELMAYYKLDSKGIAEVIRDFVKGVHAS